MTDWKLRSRSRACCKCGTGFAEGGKYRSAVVSTAGHEYVREDYCEACWGAFSAAVPPPDFISAWQGVYPATEPETPEALPKETAETLLRRMLEHGGDDATPAVVFVLAVMLERKRILIERGVRRGAGDALTRVYEHRKTGEILLILDPALGMDEVPGVQQQIDYLLKAGSRESPVSRFPIPGSSIPISP